MLKTRSIQLQTNSLVVHDRARHPYLVSLDISNPASQRISPEAIAVFQLLNPVQVVQVERNRFKFFAGWFWLEVCRRIGVERVQVVVHRELTGEEIQRFAWHDFLSYHLMIPNHRLYLANLVNQINGMPIGIKKSLFGELYTKSAITVVKNLLNESQSAIIHQIKKSKTKEKSVSTVSIFDQLVGKEGSDE